MVSYILGVYTWQRSRTWRTARVFKSGNSQAGGGYRRNSGEEQKKLEIFRRGDELVLKKRRWEWNGWLDLIAAR